MTELVGSEVAIARTTCIREGYAPIRVQSVLV